MVQEVSTTKSSSDNEVRKLTTNVTRSRIVAAVESEDDEVRASEEERTTRTPQSLSKNQHAEVPVLANVTKCDTMSMI